ncbi:MAG: CHC2 zinc finger domain-containing protein, partial [Gammaproteobacteria bacterium]|nr:CHC2 zinc finger domain-containing protein [Gammaproteobacteria bacterium]
MIPDEAVAEVLLRADLVEVVGESVKLTRSGKDWKGKCPFHDDRTPSFYVVPDKGFYNCFGCGASGDLFSFVMKQGGMDFPDAVRALGARYGVELRERAASRGRHPHRALYEVNAFAKSWFRRNLEDPEAGAAAGGGGRGPPGRPPPGRPGGGAGGARAGGGGPGPPPRAP